jgi:dsDNA-specific endonuclease/ATPase MutS2
MSMPGALVSVAQHEFKALAQDTKGAIGSLERQRASAAQAIETAQQAVDRPSQLRGDTHMLVTSLLDDLERLSAALDQVIDEVEHI